MRVLLNTVKKNLAPIAVIDDINLWQATFPESQNTPIIYVTEICIIKIVAATIIKLPSDEIKNN